VTLFIDSRAGSHELVRPLQRLGLDVEETTLDFADVAFEGRGEHGRPVSIGIEFKKLGECVQAMQTQRLQGHQAPGLAKTYDFRWLLVEGDILFNKQGRLLKRAGRRTFTSLPGHMLISEYWKRIHVLHLCWGLNPAHTESRAQTLTWIEALYRTWTDQDLDKHTSHLAIYTPPRIVPIGPFREAVCQWPRIGLRTSKAVEERFQGSLRRAARASVDEWAAVATIDDAGHTKRLGMKAAAEIDRFLEGSRG